MRQRLSATTGDITSSMAVANLHHDRGVIMRACTTSLQASKAKMQLSSAGVLVADAQKAYETSVSQGAVSVQPPTVLRDGDSGTEQTVAEVLMYGDCVLRFVSGDYKVGLKEHSTFQVGTQ